VSEREGSWGELVGDRDRWLTLVATGVGEEIVGFCSVAMPGEGAGAGEKTAEIGALYVDPGHWRVGIGGALLAAALGELAARGWRDLVLWVLPENRPARAFYERFGFTVEPGIEKREERSGRPVIRLRVSLDEPVELVAYDRAWPGRFEEERAALQEKIGRWISGGIHHVGSTAVPGLDAKPVIDILVGVEGLEASRACFGALAGLGYLYAPYRVEEMHWFCKPHPSRRSHHLHLVPTGSRRFRDELAFRDRLRSNPELGAEYAALKRALAERFRTDRDAYTEAKGGFVARVLADERPGRALA
jgi:GrpB-like predicted nucleotidyltransferase (UPF0157 family)/GNAT superfamily N-acetyltransferase